MSGWIWLLLTVQGCSAVVIWSLVRRTWGLEAVALKHSRRLNVIEAREAMRK